MKEPTELLQARINKMVTAKIFRSEQHAIESILQWLQELENDFIVQQMHDEDA